MQPDDQDEGGEGEGGGQEEQAGQRGQAQGRLKQRSYEDREGVKRPITYQGVSVPSE